MKSVNKIILLGNLAAEPEFRTLSNGTAVATVSMATNESYKDAQGNMQDLTEWHKLVFWQKLADIVHQYLHKGSKVYVEGKLRTRSYDDQNGQKRYITEVQVSDLVMLGDSQSNSNNQPQQQWNNQPPTQQQWNNQPPTQPQQWQSNQPPQMPYQNGGYQGNYH